MMMRKNEFLPPSFMVCTSLVCIFCFATILAVFRNLSSLSSNVILLWIHYENNSSANFELVYIGAMDNGSAGNPRS